MSHRGVPGTVVLLGGGESGTLQAGCCWRLVEKTPPQVGGRGAVAPGPEGVTAGPFEAEPPGPTLHALVFMYFFPK